MQTLSDHSWTSKQGRHRRVVRVTMGHVVQAHAYVDSYDFQSYAKATFLTHDGWKPLHSVPYPLMESVIESPRGIEAKDESLLEDVNTLMETAKKLLGYLR